MVTKEWGKFAVFFITKCVWKYVKNYEKTRLKLIDLKGINLLYYSKIIV